MFSTIRYKDVTLKQFFRQVLTGILVLVLMLLGYGEISAQTEAIKWLRYDVTINIQQNSGISFEEIQEVSLYGGVTSFERIIPTSQLIDIQNIDILEINSDTGQHTYQQAESGDYSFQVISEKKRKIIKLQFPSNYTGSTKFIIRYFVVGSLFYYDEGDRFEWQPAGEDITAPIDKLKIVVRLPKEVEINKINATTVGATTERFLSTDKEDVNEVIFNARAISPDDSLKILVRFPHGVIQGSPAQWQLDADKMAYWSPLLLWISIILGLLSLIIVPLAVAVWWYLYVNVMPPKLSNNEPVISPPGELSPAVAGALLNGGKATHKHLTATLLDMAYNGTININDTEDNKEKLEKFDGTADFYLYGVEQDKATRPYEATVYGKIFGYTGGKKRLFSKVHARVLMSTPELKNQIDYEVVKNNYLSIKVAIIRRQCFAFGGAGVLLSISFSLLMIIMLGRYTIFVGFPFFGIIAGSVVLIVTGFFAPNLSKEGAEEAEHWKAFKHHLKSISPEEAHERRLEFAKLLPYAVTFGVEKQFIQKFSEADTPIPTWWGKPEEKIPDINHENAHDWVSSAYMKKADEQPKKEAKTRTESVIRRLGQAKKETETQTPITLLKQIEPSFQAFIKAGNEMFSIAPSIEEEGLVAPPNLEAETDEEQAK